MKSFILIVFVFLNLTLNAQLKFVTLTDDNGKVVETGYLNEKNNKDSLWYSYNEEGNLVAEMEYEDGKRSGVWRFYNDEGHTIFRVLYINGKKRVGKQWDDEGRLIDYRKWDQEEHLIVQTIRKY